jgi:uncharacterized membrane protein required for colicin V production
MPADILKGLNWLDIFVIIILIRECYIASKTGLPIEIFKFLGTVAAIYIGLHYFTVLSDSLALRFPYFKEQAPLQFLDFLSCAILAIIGYVIFLSLRIAFHRFIKMEAVPDLNRWGGLILGLARGFLTVSLIIFVMLLSTVTYFKKSVAGSYSGKQLFQIAPDTYSWLWNNVTSKFMTSEKFNNAVLEVKKELKP